MKINEFAEKDVFAQHCGVELIEAGEGTAKAKLTLQDYHHNGMGITHGAAIFTLADFTFGAIPREIISRRTKGLNISRAISFGIPHWLISSSGPTTITLLPE